MSGWNDEFGNNCGCLNNDRESANLFHVAKMIFSRFYSKPTAQCLNLMMLQLVEFIFAELLYWNMVSAIYCKFLWIHFEC